MSAKEVEFSFKSALMSTGLVQPVESTSKGGKLSALCRQVPGQEAGWLQVLPRLLKASEEFGFDLHLCRKYVLRNGRLVYGWYIGVESKNTKSLMDAVINLNEILSKAKPILNKPAHLAPGKHPTQKSKDPLAAGYQPGPDFKPPKPKKVAPGRPQYETDNYRKKIPYAPPGTESTTDNPVLVVASRKQIKDRKGRPMVEEVIEVPLPHIYTEDMNKPNERGGGVLNPLLDTPLILSGKKAS